MFQKTTYFKEKYTKTVNERYGVDHYSQTLEYKTKFKKTMNERYGVDHIMQDKNFVKEFFKKYEEKTGYKTPLNNPEIREKITQTLIDVYGVNHNFLIPSVINDRKNTWIKNYGEDHPMKNIHIFYKVFYNSVTKYYNYEFANGRIEKIQGYEKKAIDELLNNGILENDIVINDIEIEKIIGVIIYKYENKQHRYYPDIYIISQNKIIEVKSTYTYKKDLEKNIQKQNAVLNKNINFEFKIYNNNI